MATSEGGGAPSPGAISPSPLLDEHATAKCLGLSVKTLRRWRWAKRGPVYVKIGTCVRYEPEALAAFVAAGRRLPAEGSG